MHSISVYSQFLAKVHWHQWLFNEIWWRNTWTYRQTTDTQIWGYLEHLNVVRNQKVDPFLLIDFMISWFWRKESTEWVRMKILILRTSRKTSFAWSSVVGGGWWWWWWWWGKRNTVLKLKSVPCSTEIFRKTRFHVRSIIKFSNYPFYCLVMSWFSFSGIALIDST